MEESIPINYTSLAPVYVSDEDDWFVFPINVSGILVEGANDMAVEIHQHDTDSSDISFDLELLLDNSDRGQVSPAAIEYVGILTKYKRDLLLDADLRRVRWV